MNFLSRKTIKKRKISDSRNDGGIHCQIISMKFWPVAVDGPERDGDGEPDEVCPKYPFTIA